MTEDYKQAAAWACLNKPGVIGELAEELRLLGADLVRLYLDVDERMRALYKAHPDSREDTPEVVAAEEVLLSQLCIIWRAVDEEQTRQIRTQCAELFKARQDNLVSR